MAVHYPSLITFFSFIVITFYIIHLIFGGDTTNPNIPRLLIAYKKLRTELVDVGYFIGNTGQKYVGSIPIESLHTYTCGETGSGKSTYLSTKAIGYICSKTPNSICVIEPHYSLSRDLALVAMYSDYKVYRISPSLEDGTITPFSPQLLFSGLSRNAQTSFLVDSLRQHFSSISSSSPVMLFTLRACLELLGDLPMFLLPEIYQNSGFRRKLLDDAPHLSKFARDFFKEFETLSRSKRESKFFPAINKIENLHSDLGLLYLFGQPVEYSLNIEKIINTKNTLLVVDLNRASNPSSAAIIGTLVMNIIRQAIFRRKANDKSYPMCYLFADEFQAYTNQNLSIFLAEARKYRIALTLSNQFPGQIENLRLREELRVNTNINVTFALPEHHAKFFGNQYGKDTAQRIANLPKYKALLLDKRYKKHPVMLETVPIDLPDQDPYFESAISVDEAKRNVEKLIEEVEALQEKTQVRIHKKKNNEPKAVVSDNKIVEDTTTHNKSVPKPQIAPENKPTQEALVAKEKKPTDIPDTLAEMERLLGLKKRKGKKK